MEYVKVVKVTDDSIYFDNGIKLSSKHVPDCCENHYLDFSDLTLMDFGDLKFDLSKDDFFEKIEDYGILLKPINGHPVRVPGYGENNGEYSTNLTLIIIYDGKIIKSFDIEKCQKIDWGG